MTYSSELSANPTAFVTNIVIDIDGTKYAKYQPDSGLTVPVANRIVDEVKINPTVIDLKKAITKINTTSVKVIDKDEIFSIAIGNDSNALIGKTIEVFVGRIGTAAGGSFDWTDYISINKYKINGIERSDRFYIINAIEEINEAQVPIYDFIGNLNSDIDSSVTTFVLNTGTDSFNTSGYIRIDDEWMSYSGKSFLSGDTTLTGVSRGLDGSIAAAHKAGAEAQFFEEIQDNPINIILKILISNGGGGAFDTLFDGVGIDNTLIDVTAFTTIRDNFFTGETFKLYLGGIPNALKYIQDELLLATNTRLIQNQADNKISLAILDQVDFGASVPLVDSSRSMPNPKYRVTADGIQNNVRVRWDWSEGLQQYKQSTLAEDSSSQTLFGVKKGPELAFKGIQSGLSGSTIVSDRTSRFLARFSTPQTKIETRVFMEHSLINVGSKLRYTTSELPSPGGGLGFSSILELLKVGINFNTGIVNHTYVFTSFTNQRVAVIAPAPFASSIVSQSQFDVTGFGSFYEAGDKVRLWNDSTRVYESDPVNTISGISGDTLTFENAWSTTVTTSHKLKLADYNDASSSQRARYGFIAPGVSEVFDDGTKAFQIIL